MFWKLSPSYFTHQTQQRWEIRWIRSTSPSMECRTWWAWPSTPTTASPPMSGRLPASLGPRWRLWINSDKLAKFRDAKVKVAELNLWQGILQQNQLRCLHCNCSLILTSTSFKLSSTWKQGFLQRRRLRCLHRHRGQRWWAAGQKCQCGELKMQIWM